MQVSVVTKKESLSLICAETETTVLLKCLQAAYGIAQMPAGAYRIAQMPEAHKCVESKEAIALHQLASKNQSLHLLSQKN